MPRTHSHSKSADKRFRMISEAAYFRAEKRGFDGNHAIEDWIEAEEEIDRVLLEPRRMKDKEAFRKRIEAQLDEWDERLDELRQKAREAGIEIRADFNAQIEALAEKRAALQGRLHELLAHTGSAWQDLRGGIEKSWDEMRKALDRISSRFK